MPRWILSVEDRFWSKVDKKGENECWNWQAMLSGGYGHFKLNNTHVKAHRFAYEQFKGSIPEGKVIDHLCRNKKCVNPAHLEPVTNRENILRGEGLAAKEARRTHCKRGHLLSGDNIRMRVKDGRESRVCRKCHAIETLADYHRKRACV